MHFTADEVTTMIAALEALSVSEYRGEYESLLPLLRRFKAVLAADEE